MKFTSATEQPVFRPLLDYARVLGIHQNAATQAERPVAAEALCHVIDRLVALQDAYEHLPGKAQDRWFLAGAYATSRDTLKRQCALLKSAIDQLRLGIFKPDEDPAHISPGMTLESLSEFLMAASEDASCLSNRVVVAEPAITLQPDNPTGDDSLWTIEP